MIAACRDDAACTGTYGDLEELLEEVAGDLERNPVVVPAYIEGEGDDPVEVLIDAPRFVDMLHGFLYSPWAIEYLPEELMLAAEGDDEAFSLLATYALSGWSDMARGMQRSVNCAEELPLNPEYEPAPARGDMPFVRRYGFEGLDGFVASCAVWDVPEVEPELLAPFTSDIPTLVLSGTFDPITPPSYAEEVASHYERSQLFVFGDESHGLLGSSCAVRLIYDFLDEPDSKLVARCEPAERALAFYNRDGVDDGFLFDDPFAGARCWGDRLEECLEPNPALESQAVDPAECLGPEARVCLVPVGNVREDVVAAIVDFHRETAGIEILVLPSISIEEGWIGGSSQVGKVALFEGMEGAFGFDAETPSSFIAITPVDMYPDDGLDAWVFGARFGSGPMGHTNGVFSYFRMENVEPYSDRELDDQLLFERVTKYMGRYVALLHLHHPTGEDRQYLNYHQIYGFRDLDSMGARWPEGVPPCLGDESVICIVPDNDYASADFEGDLHAAIERLNADLDVPVEMRLYASGGSYYPSQESWSDEFRRDLHTTFGPLIEQPHVTMIGVTDDALARAEHVAPHVGRVWSDEKLAVASSHGAGRPGTAEHRERLYRVLLRAVLQAHYELPLTDDEESILWEGIVEPADLDEKRFPDLP